MKKSSAVFHSLSAFLRRRTHRYTRNFPNPPPQSSITGSDDITSMRSYSIHYTIVCVGSFVDTGESFESGIASHSVAEQGGGLVRGGREGGRVEGRTGERDGIFGRVFLARLGRNLRYRGLLGGRREEERVSELLWRLYSELYSVRTEQSSTLRVFVDSATAHNTHL